MMYHGGAPVASGGFLAIDVFFVLSGYLITDLLMAEYSRHRGIGLPPQRAPPRRFGPWKLSVHTRNIAH